MAPPHEYDVAIVGGGPAGATVALRLGQLGKRVVLCEKQAFPRAHVGESLTAAILPLLDVLGVRAEVLGAGYAPSRHATVSWAGETTRYEVHGGPSLIVDRAAFDAALLEAASKCPNVSVLQPARVVQATLRRGQWELALHTGETVRAPFLVEATGRARLFSRKRRALGARTLAMYAYFQGAKGIEEADTIVESGQEGWYWGAYLPTGELNATVFVDPGQRSDYGAWLAQSSLLGPRLLGAERVRGPFVCDATPYVDQTCITHRMIRVGDAALSLDPLSSQGVYTAMGTALHAAVVLHTMHDRPADTALAMGFYQQRIESSAAFHTEAAADFYRRQALVSNAAFWQKRATMAAAKPVMGSLEPQVRVTLSRALRFASVPIVTEAYIEPADGILMDGEPFAFVDRGIALAPLLREVRGPMRAMEVVQAWSRRMSPEQALRILQWAWAQRLLEATGSG